MMRKHLKKVKPYIYLFNVVALVVAAYIFAMFQGGFVSWFIFYSFLPFALYGVALKFYSVKKWTIKRSWMKKEFQAGDSIELMVTVTRRIPFPLVYVMIEDDLPASLNQKPLKKIVFPLWKRTFTIYGRLENVPRGEHWLEKINIKTGDLLGFFEKEQTVKVKDRLLVYPRYQEMRFTQADVSKGEAVAKASVYANAESLLATGVREYYPGDKLSRIDWKATARKQTMMTKEFDTLQGDYITIIIDRTNQQTRERFEHAVSLTASLSYSLLRSGHNFSFVSEGREHNWISPDMSRISKQQLFIHLAKIQADCTVPLFNILEKIDQLPQRHGTLYLIVTQITEDVKKTVVKLSERYNVNMIFVALEIRQEEMKQVESFKKNGIVVKVITNSSLDEVHVGVNRS